ncbi:DUF1329 domain-containing protein [Halopseudomonas sp. SMJS2]|uniref:DUF1329 domain-containing protein n=1 Tax=Halopseudomonas sp. SMJS2 TaxID=3041098 RepID=UPI0024529D53|nr:DUF1329 domain-containing protein [Halopseudomonas sp. SMJS2]WGK62457.1 DUF1329 domain-containing protein [Halopseudomonas sp. SMJS2]
MKRFACSVIALAISGGAALSVQAEDMQEKISQIGTKYTPWGAEKEGNADGSIPAYTGPIAVPATYDPAKPGYRPDPFADEKPLYSVTSENMEQYADQLTEGMQALLRMHPTFRMDVYPTHRTASYPDLYVENAEKNLTACKTVNDELGLSGCYAGTPFPFPKTGNEVMWNRLLKFDQFAFETPVFTGSVVDARGRRNITGVAAMSIQYPIYDPKNTGPIADDAIYEMVRNDFTDPPRKNGQKTVVRDSIDMVGTGRRAWQYLPGQRRVKLAPDISYDTPSPTGGGVAVTDELAIFYGALDRYDFKLQGKKEMFIPYNTYKIQDQAVCPDDVAETPDHLNPDCMRWEKHRVWVVEATLKEGKRHVYPRRVLYFDEDLWGTGIGDNFDAAGNVYRVTHNLPITFYEANGHATDQTVTYDLSTGAYHRSQNTTMGGGWVITDGRPDTFFSPQAMSGGGIR